MKNKKARNVLHLFVLIILTSHFSPLTSKAQSFVYANTVTGLPDLLNSKIAVGDVDNDNDMDVLLSGTNSFNTNITRLYVNNNNGSFTDKGISVAQLFKGDLAFCDYNNDNYLDFIITGLDASNQKVSKIYKNNPQSGTFTATSIGLVPASFSTVSWFDFDNDGDHDLLLSGLNNAIPSRRFTQLYRNDRNDVFTPVTSNIPAISHGSAHVADFNKDGFLDVAIMGINANNTYTTDIFNGDGKGSFTAQGFGFTQMALGDLEAGDYNQDGYPDLAINGVDFGSTSHTEIYFNTIGLAFTNSNAGLIAENGGSVSWGDSDNDGDLDLLVTGSTGTYIGTNLYRNDGSNIFSNITSGFTDINFGQAVWLDYDKDHILDVLVSGNTYNSPTVTNFYRNTTATANTIPAAPSQIKHLLKGDSARFTWNPATDNETASQGLTYNVWLSAKKDSFTVRSPMADLTTGFNRIPQPGRHNTTTTGWIKGLPQNKYYFRLQAIDNAFEGSAFSSLDSFLVCNAIHIGKDTSVCLKNTYPLQVGSGSEVVNWFSKKLGLVKSNSFTYLHTVTGTDTVWAQLNNPIGCVLYDTLIIKALPLPDVALNPTLKKCFKDSFTLVQGAISDTVRWYSSKGLLTTNFTFTGTALKKDTIWTKITSQKGCINSDTILIDTLSLPRFSLGKDTAACLGQEMLTLNINRSDTISWYTANTIIGFNTPQIVLLPITDSLRIWARAKDINGCLFYDTLLVRARVLPVAFAGRDSIICHKVPHVLGADTVAKSGSPPYSFTWNPAVDLDNTSIAKPTTHTLTDTVYTVRVTDAKGCFANDTVKIKVNPQTIVNAGSGFKICIGNSTPIGDAITAKGSLFPYHYQWIPDLPNVPNPIVKPTSTTIYTLFVTTRNCPADSAKTTVVVNPLPKPYSIPQKDTTTGYGEPIALAAFGGKHYQWFPAEPLNDASAQKPVATLNRNTLFIVLITDSNECKAYDSLNVIVKNEIFVPDLFSPNEDRQNDAFRVHGVGIENLRLAIFDRYGQKIYESQDWNEINQNGWNGKYKGEEQPEGAYLWTLSGIYRDGSQIYYKGNQKGTLILMR